MTQTVVDKRKNAIINLTYFVLLLVGYVLFVKFAFWIVAPFIIALVTAMVLQKPIKKISDKTHIAKKVVAVVAVILVVAIFLGIVVFAGYRIVVQVGGFIDYIKVKINDWPTLVNNIEMWLIKVIRFLPDGIEKSAAESIGSFTERISEQLQDEENSVAASLASSAGSSLSGLGIDASVLASPLGGILSTAKHIPAILLAILISIISCFFMTVDYENLVNLIKKNISAEREQSLTRAKRLMIGSVGKMIRSYIIIIGITFAELFVGLNILKAIGVYESGYIAIISIITAILDILPVLGTGTVMLPWAVYSLITGKIGLGIGLLIVYVVITVIRQIIEPKLVAMNLGLPPVVTLMGMYIGLQVFGVLGMFLVPLTIVMVKILNAEGLIQFWTPREKIIVEPRPSGKKSKKSN